MTDQLRTLVRAQLLANGHHHTPQTVTDAARQIGVQQSHLSLFLTGRQHPGPLLCIKLAAWLNHPVADVLAMAGHADYAPYLPTSPTPSHQHPAVAHFAALIANAPDDVISAALDAAAAVIRVAKHTTS